MNRSQNMAYFNRSCPWTNEYNKDRLPHYEPSPQQYSNYNGVQFPSSHLASSFRNGPAGWQNFDGFARFWEPGQMNHSQNPFCTEFNANANQVICKPAQVQYRNGGYHPQNSWSNDWPNQFVNNQRYLHNDEYALRNNSYWNHTVYNSSDSASYIHRHRQQNTERLYPGPQMPVARNPIHPKKIVPAPANPQPIISRDVTIPENSVETQGIEKVLRNPEALSKKANVTQTPFKQPCRKVNKIIRAIPAAHDASATVAASGSKDSTRKRKRTSNPDPLDPCTENNNAFDSLDTASSSSKKLKLDPFLTHADLWFDSNSPAKSSMPKMPDKLYHYTTKEGADSILRDGYIELDQANSAKYGFGIYFTDIPPEAETRVIVYNNYNCCNANKILRTEYCFELPSVDIMDLSFCEGNGFDEFSGIKWKDRGIWRSSAHRIYLKNSKGTYYKREINRGGLPKSVKSFVFE